MDYEAIIIGSGQGGKPLAFDFANTGKKVLLIEKDAVGGTCVNRGCTPTKTMVASAKIAYQTQRLELFGIEGSFNKINIQKVIARKQKIVDSFRISSEKKIETNPNLDLVYGIAKFLDPNQIQVGDKIYSAPLIFINTGADPATLAIDGLDQIQPLNSTSIMEVSELPLHLIIIGSSYIALEFGQMFRRFGSDVSIIARGDRLITREDPDISDEVKKILEDEKIAFHFNAQVKKVSKGIKVVLDSGQILTGSHLLIATGRTPSTKDLNLEAAGVAVDEKGFIKANDKLQTSQPHIYVIGDVKGGPAFTHISYDDYRILRDNLLHGKNQTIKNRLVPYTVFMDPQLGRVGISEEEAKKKNIPHLVFKMPMNYVARALEIDETRGLMKVIVHKETEEILGCAILGTEGGEVMSMIEIAMMGKMSYKKLKEGTFAHPTLAEALNTVLSLPPS
jgi:pyruvate/2-oxoglutarate dehydrogenase complex dihydrolipoamide dehydrogenase (E3) component